MSRQTGIGEPIVLCYLNSCLVNKHYQLVGGVWYEQILYSGKLLREKTFAKYEVWYIFAKFFFAKLVGMASFGDTSHPGKFSAKITSSRKFPTIRYFIHAMII